MSKKEEVLSVHIHPRLSGYKQTREYVIEAIKLVEKRKKILARMDVKNYWEGEEGEEF